MLVDLVIMSFFLSRTFQNTIDYLEGDWSIRSFFLIKFCNKNGSSIQIKWNRFVLFSLVSEIYSCTHSNVISTFNWSAVGGFQKPNHQGSFFLKKSIQKPTIDLFNKKTAIIDLTPFIATEWKLVGILWCVNVSTIIMTITYTILELFLNNFKRKFRFSFKKT